MMINSCNRLGMISRMAIALGFSKGSSAALHFDRRCADRIQAGEILLGAHCVSGWADDDKQLQSLGYD